MHRVENKRLKHDIRQKKDTILIILKITERYNLIFFEKKET